MKYLVDTNVISEIRKGNRCNPGVSAWYATVTDGDLFLSVLVLGEIRKGLEWGCLNAIRPVPVIDGLLAATAKVHGLTLVTRNEADVAGLGAAVLNPFT